MDKQTEKGVFRVLTPEQRKKIEEFLVKEFPETPFCLFCFRSPDEDGTVQVSSLFNVKPEVIAPHILQCITDWLPPDQFLIQEVSEETLDMIRQVSVSEGGEA